MDAFYRLWEARDAIDVAMAVLRHAGAIIIDLRGKGGGAPDTVAYLASHFIGPPSQPLFKIVPRRGEVNAYPVMKTTPNTADAVRPSVRQQSGDAGSCRLAPLGVSNEVVAITKRPVAGRR